MKGRCEVNGWTWALLGFVALIVGALVAGGPDIARYMRIKRM
jgi:hypothetical protein